MKNNKKFFDQKGFLRELAKCGIHKSNSWAEQARFRKCGPRFCKIGGTVYYRSDWIQGYIEECEESTITKGEEL
jgi:hypothetical protein